MSAYHRLISYIYAYEGGIKGKNTGFAKLETRGTSCRIQVSVRRVFAGGSPIGVYLLAGQEEIRIGTLFVRGGNGEFRAVVNCENIEGSGCIALRRGIPSYEYDNAVSFAPEGFDSVPIRRSGKMPSRMRQRLSWRM